jgi:hypothetical protein
MAQNPIPENLDELISMSEDAADGAHQLEATVGLKQNTEVALRADLNNLIAKKGLYDTALAQGKNLTSALRVARSNARGFCAAVRDRLKNFLGGEPSEAWREPGWSEDSIAVPSTSDKLLPLLGSIQGYFTAHPTHEDTSAVNLTATRADTLHTALSDARSALNTHEQAEGNAKNARDAAADQMHQRLRALINELALLLEPLDPAWLTFGFKKPGAPDSPDAVQNTRATALGSGNVRVQSDPAPRAEYYQYFRLVVGADPDFVLADSFDEPDKILEAQPLGATVKYKMRAVNETGPGPFGAEAQVVVT